MPLITAVAFLIIGPAALGVLIALRRLGAPWWTALFGAALGVLALWTIVVLSLAARVP